MKNKHNPEKWMAVVVSDNHGDQLILTDLYSIYKDQATLFLHCGDSEADRSDSNWHNMVTVKGNMDHSEFPLSRMIEVEQDRILLTHGHKQRVKVGLNQLMEEGKEQGATIILFGHSHIPYCERQDGLLLLNPGSISLPKGPHPKSYALLSVTPDQFEIRFYNDRHQEIKGLGNVFSRKTNSLETKGQNEEGRTNG